MFGRDLTQQVRDDSNGNDRQVPVIVEKCIDAVEALGVLRLSAARVPCSCFFSSGL